MSAHAGLIGLIHLMKIEMAVLISGLAIIVFYQMLTGKIRLDNLFAIADGSISGARIQLFVTSLAVAGQYLADPRQISTGSGSAATAGALLGGSSLFYLIQKFRSLRDIGGFDGQ